MTEVIADARKCADPPSDRHGKYLTCSLGPEDYGLEILKVREIIGYLKVTAVPGTPSYVKGIINLRGQVIPVIDLRERFGMEPATITEHTCIIVVETVSNQGVASTGVIVDQVQEVLDIARDDIEPAPEFGTPVNMGFILGMGKTADSVKILLDINRVLNDVNLGPLSARAGSCPATSEPQSTWPLSTSAIQGNALTV